MSVPQRIVTMNTREHREEWAQKLDWKGVCAVRERTVRRSGPHVPADRDGGSYRICRFPPDWEMKIQK